MKKIMIVLLLCIACLSAAQAQNQLIKGTPGTSQANSIIYDDGTNVGIGTYYPTSSLTVINNGTSPNAVLEVINDHGSTNDALQINRYVTGTGLGFTTVHDITVSRYGLMGIGTSSPAAHLDISNPAGDNNPLIQATPYGATTPLLHVASTTTDGTPVVSIGGPVIDVPDFTLQVQGNTGIGGTLGVFGPMMGTQGLVLGGDGNGTGMLDIFAQSLSGADHVEQISISDVALKALQVRLEGGGTPVDKFVVYGDGHTVIANASIGLDLVNSTSYAGWSNQIRFIDGSNNIRHLIYDDNSGSGSSTNGNLVINTGYGGSANNVLSVLGKVQIGSVPVSSTSYSTLALTIACMWRKES